MVTDNLKRLQGKIEKHNKLKLESDPKYTVTQTFIKSLPIWVFDLSTEINSDFIADLVLSYKQNSNDRKYWEASSVLSSWSSDPLSSENNTLPELNNFLKIINSKLKIVHEQNYNYSKTYKNYKLDHYWFVVYESNDYGKLHNHGIAEMSAVYYARTPDNFAVLSFTDNDKTLDIPVKEGILVVFPGETYHSVPATVHDRERIVVSMNFAKGDLIDLENRQ